jgi:hypothetical protein
MYAPMGLIGVFIVSPSEKNANNREKKSKSGIVLLSAFGSPNISVKNNDLFNGTSNDNSVFNRGSVKPGIDVEIKSNDKF